MAKKGSRPKRKAPANAGRKGAKSRPPAAQGKADSNRTQTKSAKKARKSASKLASRTSKDRSSEPVQSQREGAVQCPVVGIGASAGGLEAFKLFLSAMPPDSGMAFVLIQHLDPNHQSMMADLLSRHTQMEVVEVANATLLEPNRVYMIPPNKYLKVKDAELLLDDPIKQRGMRMPIDYFFRSLAEARRQQAIAVILSGTGSDGTLGAKEIKGAGGMVMVQDPESAQYDGMPRSARTTGIVDFVLPIEKMPEALLRYAEHPYLYQSDDTEAGVWLDKKDPDHFKGILSLLRARAEYDFRCYKKGTLSRRIQRRMGLRQLNSLGEYLELLRRDGEELKCLFQDLLIGVTRFFREKEAWAELEESVIAKLPATKQANDSVRIWTPGCATGEESYTHAIVCLEQFERQKKNLDLQIFGTDLDEAAIQTARAGVYPANIAADVSPKRLSRFFVEDGERVRVSKRLRECTIFAVQNLIVDPPFSNLDIISCRNLLIYLEPEVQDRLMEMFHFTLAENGVLFLGASEALGHSARLFEPISKPWRIYRRKGGGVRAKATFPIHAGRAAPAPSEPTEDQLRPTALGSNDAELARRALLERFAPAAAVIDGKNQVKYYHGPVRNYLGIPEGEPTSDLSVIALEGISGKMRSVIHRCRLEQKTVSAIAPRVKRNGGEVQVEIVAEPLRDAKGSEDRLLVIFRDLPLASGSVPANGSPQPARGDKAGRIFQAEAAIALQQVEYELQVTREDLQTTIEELETSNEELQASSEEVMSMNEELQSTNEELETSREELQSLNEELSTVNSELEDKVDELEHTNDDLNNLLFSTQIATLFLDSEFRIRRFTPAAKELLNVIDTDVGRPISDLAPRVRDKTLLEDAKAVMENLVVSEKVVENGGSRSFMRRIRPYRTSDNRIEGVVITLDDISSIVEARDTIARRERQQATIAALGRKALAGADLQELFDEATLALKAALGADFVKVLEYRADEDAFLLRAGVGWKNGLVGEARVSAGIESQAGYTMARQAPVVVEDLGSETRFDSPGLLSDHGVVSGISVNIGPAKREWGVLGIHNASRRTFSSDDINFVQSVAYVLFEAIDAQRAARELSDAEERLRLSQEAGGIGTWDWNVVDDKIVWSDGLYRICGIDPERLTGYESWMSMIHPDDRAVVEKAAQEAVDGGGDFKAEFRFLRGDGEEIWLYSAGNVFLEGGKAVRMLGASLDITPRVEAERLNKKAEELSRLSLEAGQIGNWELDLDSKKITWGPDAYRLYGLASFKQADSTEAVLELVHQDDRSNARKEVVQAIESGGPYESEFRVVWPDGSVHWLLAKGAVVGRDSAGKPKRLVGVNIDVTDRKSAEAALLSSERNVRRSLAEIEAVYQNSPVGLCVFDHQQNVLRMNQAMVRISGMPAPDATGKTSSDAAPQIDQAVRERLEKVIRSGEPLLDCEFATRAGEKPGARHWLSSWLPITDEDGRVELVTCVVQDITARKTIEKKLTRHKRELEVVVRKRTKELLAANEELEDSRRELRELTARLINVQEESYRRLARELHDAFVQHLAVLAMRLGHLTDMSDKAARPATEFEEEVTRARKEIERLSREIHDTARRLHPTILDDLGLEAALREAARYVSGSNGIDSAFYANLDGVEDFPKDIELALYRVTQECLNNVAQHAAASAVRVELDRTDDGVVLRIEDDGKGFDPDEISLSKGIGLIGVRERVRMVGGELNIESADDKGTTVEVRMPLARASDGSA